MFLQMQLFGSLKLSMALWGPSWPLLGPIWYQNGSQNGSKSGPERGQKLVQKLTPKISKNWPIWGRKIGPEIAQNGEAPAQANLDGGFQNALGPKTPCTNKLSTMDETQPGFQ